VTVDCVGLTAQSYSASTSTTDGVRTLSLSGMLQDSESQALDMAQYLATVYSSGDARISQVVIHLNTTQHTADQIVSVLSLDITDLVSVTYTPNRVGAAISQQCIVEGVAHDIGPGYHTVTLSLGKFDNRSVFILDDPIFGLLDSTSVLTF
jgi:hypothetical protein